MTHTLDQLDTSKFDIPMTMESIFIEDNAWKEGGSGFKPVDQSIARAVMREDTGEVLAVHGPKYQLVPHNAVFDRFNEALFDSGIDLGAIVVKDEVLEGARKTKRTINFLDHRRSVDGNDENTLKLTLFNSVDGSWAFQSFFGAFRNLCQNSLVFGGQKIAYSYGRHTANIDVAKAAAKVGNGMQMFGPQMDRFESWFNTRVNDQQVIKLLEQTICKVPSKTAGEGKEPVNRRLCDRIFTGYIEETSSLYGRRGGVPESLWALYNALTAWSTHVEGDMKKTSQTHRVQFDREAKVRKVIESPQWRELEAA